jgi:hypothetical protein
VDPCVLSRARDAVPHTFTNPNHILCSRAAARVVAGTCMVVPCKWCVQMHGSVGA